MGTGAKGKDLQALQQQRFSDSQLRLSQQQLEQKHAELERLFASVEQAKYEWQVALDCIADMILLVDQSGRVKRCNEAFIRFVGCSYLDVLGKDWQRMLLNGQQDFLSLNQSNKQLFHQQKQVMLFQQDLLIDVELV